LYEYCKSGWSFHSKGIWFYEKNKEFPSLCVIGSSNYNYRSFERDVESQFYIYSFCEKFSQKMHNENEDIFGDCINIQKIDIRKDKDTKVKLKHKIFGRLLRKYL
jgi:CDP-diacylglycerol--glycerol-3-phosphate 3-phosphatidyltransferase